MVFSSDTSRVVERGADVLIISPLQRGGIPFTTLEPLEHQSLIEELQVSESIRPHHRIME